MKRVLLMSYFFPPIANSATQRPTKLANYLLSHGWSPTVLTVEQPPDRQIDPRLLHEVDARVSVSRVPMGSLIHARRIAALAGPFRAHVADGLEWRLRWFHQFPDVYDAWRAPALRSGLKLHAETPFDAVFATGFPWSTLVSGIELARRIRRPCVVDFQDPWTADNVFDQHSLHSRWRRRSISLEKFVLRKAQHVTAVTAALGDLLRCANPAGGAPVSIVPNGYDGRDLARAEPTSPPPDGRVRIVYPGVWRQGYNPGALYDAVERMRHTELNLSRRLEVIVAGYPPGEARRRGLDEVIDERGYVPHPVALGLMQSADVLFLPLAGGIHQEVQVPGKLYEYLAVGKPVLALTHPDGSTGKLLTSVGGGLITPPDNLDALVAILEHLCQYGSSQWPRASRDAVARFEWSELSGELAGILNRLAASEAR